MTDDRFKNRMPGQVIQSGDDYVIVYDWTKTAEEIIAEATRIHAYRDQDGVRWYFVVWEGLSSNPLKLGLHQLDDERLRFFVENLHAETKARSN